MKPGTPIRRLSTGNEFVSIPSIRAASAGIDTIGFMHSAFRACVELHGSQNLPLLEPVLEIEGDEQAQWEVTPDMLCCWIPRFTIALPGISAAATVLAPLERRGFVYLLEITNTADRDLRLRAGWRGCWERTYHTASLSKLMAGVKHGSISSWKPGVPVIEYRGHTPLFAMALVSQEVTSARIWRADGGAEVREWTGEPVTSAAGQPICYELTDRYVLGPGEELKLPVYVGLGLEEVCAVSSAQDLRLHGWERILDSLRGWLESHSIRCDDDRLGRLLNVNSFYNYFLAQAIALDSEQLVLTSSRSSRSDACAAYRDHDAMLWSLPAVLQINWAQARKMLIYALTIQLANVGIRSRFIDGIVLEPGLQLDQLCAPILALRNYVEVTGDMSVLFDRRVQTGVNAIQQVLAVQRHPEVALFETLLLPSGEPSRYPYVCYSNVIVWRALLDASWMYERIRDLDRADEAIGLSNQVRAAIVESFIVPGPFGRMYARAVDLRGNYELGDDPAGSLQLLSFHDFCADSDPVYANTVKWIHSEHNPFSCQRSAFAAPGVCDSSGPSLASVINDLITGRSEQALDFLRRAELDDGIACESVDPHTGRASRGPAFASCAGYLAFGLRMALNATLPDSAITPQKRRPSEALYQPPPETSQDSRKARM